MMQNLRMQNFPKEMSNKPKRQSRVNFIKKLKEDQRKIRIKRNFPFIVKKIMLIKNRNQREKMLLKLKKLKIFNV